MEDSTPIQVTFHTQAMMQLYVAALPFTAVHRLQHQQAGRLCAFADMHDLRGSARVTNLAVWLKKVCLAIHLPKDDIGQPKDSQVCVIS